MNEREKREILGYDLETLEKNIEKRKKEIKVLIELIARKPRNPEAFSAEIEEAKKDIVTLESYIQLIKRERGIKSDCGI